MSKPTDIENITEKSAITLTSITLAALLKSNPAETLQALPLTPAELILLKDDPILCAVLSEVNLLAPYLFPVQPSEEIKQIGAAVIDVGLEAAQYTVNRAQTDEGIIVHTAKIRANILAIAPFRAQVATSDYLISRIRLAICQYWVQVYNTPVSKRIVLSLALPERIEWQSTLAGPTSLDAEKLAILALLHRAIRSAAGDALASSHKAEVTKVADTGVHAKIAERIVTARTEAVIAASKRTTYPDENSLITLATDPTRLKRAASILAPFLKQ